MVLNCPNYLDLHYSSLLNLYQDLKFTLLEQEPLLDTHKMNTPAYTVTFCKKLTDYQIGLATLHSQM